MRPTPRSRTPPARVIWTVSAPGTVRRRRWGQTRRSRPSLSGSAPTQSGAALADRRARLAQAAQLSPDGDERVRRQLLAAEFAAAVGDFDQALALADRAQRDSADPRLRAQAWLIRGRVAILSGQLAVWPARLVEAAEAVAEVDPAMAAIMMIEAVVSHLGSGDREQFIRTARRAWEIGRPLGGMIEAAAATARAASMVIYETPRDALPLLARAAPAMEDPSLWQLAPELAGLYGRVIFGTGDFVGGERLLTAIIDHSRANRCGPRPLLPAGQPRDRAVRARPLAGGAGRRRGGDRAVLATARQPGTGARPECRRTDRSRTRARRTCPRTGRTEHRHLRPGGVADAPAGPRSVGTAGARRGAPGGRGRRRWNGSTHASPTCPSRAGTGSSRSGLRPTDGQVTAQPPSRYWRGSDSRRHGRRDRGPRR